MRVIFENVSKVQLTKNSKSQSKNPSYHLVMTCPVEGEYGGELDFELQKCDLQIVDGDEIVVKKIYDS